MTPSTRSIARFMFLIAWLALDMSILRMILVEGESPQDVFGISPLELVVTFGLMAPLVQLALDRSIWGNPATRPFWLGVIASSLIVVFGIFLARVLEDPLVTHLWLRYRGFFYATISGDPTLRQLLAGRRTVQLLALAVYLPLPQVSLILLFGAIIGRVFRVKEESGEPLEVE